MSELMRRVLDAKRKSRLRLAALSFEEKIAIVEKMRARGLSLAANPLRRYRPQAAKKAAENPLVER